MIISAFDFSDSMFDPYNISKISENANNTLFCLTGP